MSTQQQVLFTAVAQDDSDEVLSDKDSTARTLQVLMNEQNTLSSALATNTSESNARAGLYLTISSGALIALSFVGQVSEFGATFYTFLLVLLPIVLILGAITYARLVDIAVQNLVYVQGMNRIRHYYAQVAPPAANYFVLSTYDDYKGASVTMGGLSNNLHPASRPWWAGIVTTAGMIAVLNAMLSGIIVEISLAQLFPLSVPIEVLIWLAIFILSIAAHGRFEMRRWRDLDRHVKVEFPSEPEA